MVILDQRVNQGHLAHKACPDLLDLVLKWWREGMGLWYNGLQDPGDHQDHKDHRAQPVLLELTGSPV